MCSGTGLLRIPVNERSVNSLEDENSWKERKMSFGGAKSRGVQKTMNSARTAPKVSPQMPTVLAGRQLGMGDNAYLKFKATLQELTAKIECCNLEECSGVPAKNKITLCPSEVEQVTSIEITNGGHYLFFGTSNNTLYLVDLWKLRKLDSEMIIDSQIEKISTEHFKIVSRYDTTGCINEITKVFGPRLGSNLGSRPGFESNRQGIHCLELSPSGTQLMTCGYKSNQLKVINIDETRNTRNKRKFDSFGVFDEYEVWTNLGVLKEVANNHGIGGITGGVWVDETCTASVDTVGTLKVCRTRKNKIRVPAVHQIRFPNHALPVEAGQAFPIGESLSTIVGIDKVRLRDEYIVTTWPGEIYVLKADDKLGITARGARREGIPHSEFHFSDQGKERKVLSQTVDEVTGTVIVGTLSGLTTMDTRVPHLLEHVKLYDVKKPKEVRQKEIDQGAPVKIHAENYIVTAGMYSGHIAFFDTRNKRWIQDEENAEKCARLTWTMGIQEAHGRKNRHNPNKYPLVSLRKRGGTLAAGGGPVFGGTARERTLEGVITIWE